MRKSRKLKGSEKVLREIYCADVGVLLARIEMQERTISRLRRELSAVKLCEGVALTVRVHQ